MVWDQCCKLSDECIFCFDFFMHVSSLVNNIIIPDEICIPFTENILDYSWYTVVLPDTSLSKSSYSVLSKGTILSSAVHTFALTSRIT